MAVARPAGLPLGGAQIARDRPAGGGGPDDPARSAPVIVLASAYCGAGQLGSLLAGHPDLACTSGTGILPLCQQAMATWRNVDSQAGQPTSPLAVAATRALAAGIITSVLAREGKRRWCEVAAANSQAAETFLRLYPGTKFLCLYRACPGVIRAAIDASPWGLADPAFAPFTRAHPASTVAALTAYWVAHTTTLLDFERAHPQGCLRVRYEDLTSDRQQTTGRITAFLGLASPGEQAPHAQDSDDTPHQPGNTGPEPDFPAGLIPPAIRAQASDLHRQLGYPPLPPGPATGSSSPRGPAGD
jgi:Sulfotransferase family